MNLLITLVIYQYNLKKNRGFTLIEVLLVLSIIGIVIIPIGNYLNHTVSITRNVKDKDMLLREGKFGLLFIDYEIRNAKKIYDVEEMRAYRKRFDDFGFLIELDQGVKDQSTYVFYYRNSDKIIRRALNRKSNKCPDFSVIASNLNTGNNIIIENVCELDVEYNKEINMIRLDVETNFGTNFYNFKKDIYVYNMEKYRYE